MKHKLELKLVNTEPASENAGVRNKKKKTPPEQLVVNINISMW